MVKDRIDRDPTHVCHLPKVQSILLWLFQSQDDPQFTQINKQTNKPKKREWIEDYFLQGAAYANAHNVMFGTNIDQIVILMADRNQEFKKFIASGREFDHYTNKCKPPLA